MSASVRLTVADYHELGEMGILTTEDRVELLEGYLVLKAKHTPKHASSITRTNYCFRNFEITGYLYLSQYPITLEDSEPEPDFVIARGDERAFDNRHPNATEVPIVIEISDTTLRLDREVKGAIYARSGIPEYWIVNLVESKVEVYTQPDATGYGSKVEFGTNDTVPLVLDGRLIANLTTAELIPQIE